MNCGCRNRPAGDVCTDAEIEPAPGENGLTLGTPYCGWFQRLYISVRNSARSRSAIRMLLKKFVLKLLMPGKCVVLRPRLPVGAGVAAPANAGSAIYIAVFGSMEGLPAASGLTYFVGLLALYAARTPGVPAGLNNGRSKLPPMPSASAPLVTVTGTPASNVVTPEICQPPTARPRIPFCCFCHGS